MSNKFYTFVGTMDNAIYHRYYDENKNEVCEKVEEYDYTLYVEHHSDYSGYKSLLGKKLKEFHFETPADLSKFYRENKDMLQIHGNDSAVQQFIAKEYDYDVKQTCPVNILNFDLEIEHSNGFPDPHKAEQEIMSVSVKKFGTDEIMYSIGTKPLLEYDNPKGKYIQCKDEKEVIVQFLKIWKDINPQIITGWNCVPLTNNVWMNNKIVKMKDINVNTKLYNSFVEHVYPVSNKKVFETILSNGTKTKSSKDHIYPINYIKKGKYISNIDSLIHSDNTVEEIKKLSIENDIYYKVNLGNNTNEDLTYRQLIKNNYDLLKGKGVLFKLCDTILVKKISNIVGYASKEVHKSVEFWNDENIINLTSKKEFNEYIDRNKNIIVFHKDLHGVRNSININLDEVLNSDLLWFLGMWFTDGTSTYKSEVSICNNNDDVNERLYKISKNIFRSKQNKSSKKKDGCAYTNFGLSKTWFLKLFIYDGVIAKSNKQLNISLLSQLSKSQFLSFYAGCIDGDGSIKNNAVLLSNYNDQLNEISELLLWNGIYNTISKNSVRAYINDKRFKNNLSISYKRDGIDFSTDYKRLSKSNNKRWFFDTDNNCVYTKLDTIVETNDEVEMIDISTNTHYFINNGIETHNCDNFDIPYLVNRIKNVFGKKALAHLSPFKDKVKNNDKLISERIVNDKIQYDIFGITSFDYIELYQKYNLSKQESYKLDYIGEVEIGQRKVNFDEYKKSLMNLYNGDITVDLKTPFNELDEIMKFARIREVVRRRLDQVGFSLDNGDKFLGDNIHRFELDSFDFVTIKNADNETLKGLYNFCEERVRTLSYKKFVMYNEQDANIVELLDDKMKFIKQAIRVAHMSRSRFRDIFGTVAPWDNMIYARLLAKNIQIPPRESFEKDEKFTGAYVKDPILGFHKWIVSFDYKSLYPSIIRLLKMSPESLIKGQDDNRFDTLKKILHREYETDSIREKGHGVAGNGSVFDQSIDGVLPETMEFLMEERDVVKSEMKDYKNYMEHILKYVEFVEGRIDTFEKDSNYAKSYARHESAFMTDEQIKELNLKAIPAIIAEIEDHISMLDATQQALKILANSGYGAIGNIAFRYFRIDIAEAITLTGQLALRYVSAKVDEYLNKLCGTKDVVYAIYGDTDSIYVTLDNWVKVNNIDESDPNKVIDIMDDFVNKDLSPFICDTNEDLSKYIGAKENLLIMKREALGDSMIFRGKKNYIIQVYDNEFVRYSKPKIKMMGVETAKSSTAMIIRKKLEECFNIVINKDTHEPLQLKEMVDDFRKEFDEVDIVTIASPRGIKDIDKWIDEKGNILSGCPIHVRAAIVYNNFIASDEKLKRQYEEIKNGSKIRFVKLKQPNILHSHVVAFVDDIPEEMELDKYVDRKTQFEDTFMKPLESFTQLIDWDVRRTNSLTSLFGDEDWDTQIQHEELEVKKEKAKQKPQKISVDSLFG